MSALRGGVGIGAGTGASESSLKSLIDNASPPDLADLLRAANHEAVHVRDYGMQAAADEHIVARAAEEDRIIVSADCRLQRDPRGSRGTKAVVHSFCEPGLMIADDYFVVMVPSLPCSNRNSGPVAWPCSEVAVFRSGCVQKWLCSEVAVFRSGCVQKWLCSEEVGFGSGDYHFRDRSREVGARY